MFSHLHAHTHFSFGAGVTSPARLVAAAAHRAFTSLACTDTNGVYGAVEFQQAAEAQGVRPILGTHLVTGGTEAILLATDERGWGALCRAVSRVHWTGGERENGGTGEREQQSRGRKGRSAVASVPFPGLPFSQLAADRIGLLILSPDVALLDAIAQLSGPRDLYAELRPGKERHATLAAARRLGFPAVVTGGVMFADPEDWQRHRLRAAIHANTTPERLDAQASERPTLRSHLPASGGRMVRATQWVAPTISPPDAWLRPEAALARHFPDCPEAMDRAIELAERCRYRLPIGTRVVAPRFACPDNALDHLRLLAYRGAERRYGTIAPVTRARLEHELAVIGQKGFADYFLVVHDIVHAPTAPTHCGRGSVANSIVSYALGITHVDPLSSGLLFERFLKPARTDPPDIDLDFPWDERDEVFKYVFGKYPHPRAAMVANHNCFRLRGALREVAKVHGRPPGEIREITRRFPWFMEEESIGEVITKHPNFQSLDLPAVWKELARQAQPLVGMPRHLSVHPGGVVIVPDALTDFVPTEPAAKQLDGAPDLPVPVIQFEKDGAEDIGLVKIDLLGNRSLAVIRDAIRAVSGNTGRMIDYTSADPEDDPATRRLFSTGQTMGVFYTESPASRLLCAKSRAADFELLVLNTSIIRPASNKYIRVYLERLHGTPYEPLDPSLQETLGETFGVMVYQEDVVNVCAAFAGMSLAAGDGLRKALSKKRPGKVLADYMVEFMTGAAALGRDLDRARKVWEMVLSFSGYSFCKGHSCSYIRVAQHSCYLRAHYPAEFMAAVLANGGGFYHPFAYVAEAMRMGLTVRPPDVNASRYRTTGRNREVRIGFQFIKGLTQEAVERIERGRDASVFPSEARGNQLDQSPDMLPFTSLEDFRRRTRLSHEDLRLLVKVGAFDAIAGGRTRPMLLWEVDAEQRETGGAGERENGTRLPVLPFSRSPVQPATPPQLKEYSLDRRRRTENELLGFTTDSHPMQLYAEELARLRVVRSPQLASCVGKTVVCAGMLTTAKPVHTANDEPMEFATFDDGDGLIEAVLFPGVYRSRGHVLFDQGPFVFRGKVEEEFGAITFTITGIDRLDRVMRKLSWRKARQASLVAEGVQRRDTESGRDHRGLA
jgi:error-prone DNA polymerase